MSSDDSKIQDDLFTWLQTNKLTKILSSLNENDVTELEDLQVLDTEKDINEFIEALGLSVLPRKKFKKALIKLNNISQVITNNPNNQKHKRKQSISISDDDDDIHYKWDIGSLCQIYSHSKRKWIDGKIVNIYNEGEWLTVKYARKTKDLDRYSDDIRPMNNNDNNNNSDYRQQNQFNNSQNNMQSNMQFEMEKMKMQMEQEKMKMQFGMQKQLIQLEAAQKKQFNNIYRQQKQFNNINSQQKQFNNINSQTNVQQQSNYKANNKSNNKNIFGNIFGNDDENSDDEFGNIFGSTFGGLLNGVIAIEDRQNIFGTKFGGVLKDRKNNTELQKEHENFDDYNKKYSNKKYNINRRPKDDLSDDDNELKIRTCLRCDGRAWFHNNGITKHKKPPNVKCGFCRDCKSCHGKGIIKTKLPIQKCPKCKGKAWFHNNGVIKHATAYGGRNANEKCGYCRDCSGCKGIGFLETDKPIVPCPRCKTKGWQHTLNVKHTGKGGRSYNEKCGGCRDCKTCKGLGRIK